MSVLKVKEGIYSVGVLNPSLRVFDIIMKTEYGTTYNAYLVQGTEKTALIETVHAKYFEEYYENILSVGGIDKIDYLIMNHTEPDHSGSIAALLQKNPNIEIVATNAGIKYAKSIANSDFASRVVKDGDSIDLGGKTLQFTVAPFLHWPDSMFTYLPEDKVLFSCDMFGCHYCEPRMLDLHIVEQEAYEDALLYYYTAIFSPFKPHVLSGMDKIKDLPVDYICTSHGPILTQHSIQVVWDKYKEWSTPRQKPNKQVAILYVSAYGFTRSLAQRAEVLAKQAGFDTVLYDIIKVPQQDAAAAANECDALMLGSPTINRDALKPVWDVISSIDAINCQKKPAAVFGSYGWSGEAVGMLKDRLNALRFQVFGEGCRINFKPSDTDMEAFETYVNGFLAQLK